MTVDAALPLPGVGVTALQWPFFLTFVEHLELTAVEYNLYPLVDKFLLPT